MAAAIWRPRSRWSRSSRASGTVVYEQYGNGTKKPYAVIPGGMATKIPIVVLDQ